MKPKDEARRQLAEIESIAHEIAPSEQLYELLLRSVASETPLRVKYGIDPTNPNIHIGHLVPCRLLRLFQELGHIAVLIVGDYTAQIGDPTGRNEERPVLSPERVRENARLYADQLYRVIDQDKSELHMQSSWYREMPLEQVLGLMSSFSVAQMMAHETFRSRQDRGERLSLHELMYPLLQAYDSVAIAADVEIGGTDQLFNCLCGRDLQRTIGEAPQVVVTVPLLSGPDGRKMSKSAGNHLPVNAPATEVVGKVMSIPDTLIQEYVNLATTWSPIEKATLVAALDPDGSNAKQTKTRIARNIAAFLCGAKEADAAIAEFDRVHSRGGIPRDLPSLELDTSGILIVDLLVSAKLAQSKSEARRLITQGGVQLDGERVTDLTHHLSPGPGSTVVLQVGKRRFLSLTSRRWGDLDGRRD